MAHDDSDSFTQLDEKISAIDRNQIRLEERLLAHIESEDRSSAHLRETLSDMADHLAEYNTQLAIHIAGTQANTRRIDNCDINIHKTELEINELKAHSLAVKTSWKTIVVVASFIAGTVGVITAISKFVQF